MDGMRISEAYFMLQINSVMVGGMFGLLAMSARMSAPNYTVRDTWGLPAYSGTSWGQARAVAYQTETMTVYRTFNESWSINWFNERPLAQTQTKNGSEEDKTAINALKNFLGAKKYSKCKDAVAAAKALGIAKIDDFIKILSFTI